EDFLGRRPPIPFNEAAGEFAGGVGLLAVIDDEGEEVAALVGLALDGGDERHGVAVLDDDRAVGLLGPLAGFDDEFAFADRTFDTTCLHGFTLLGTGRSRHAAG